MVWDDNKEPKDELTSDEWDAHVTDQKNHSGRHESGGSDEITVTGLSGDLADPQDPKQEAVDDFVNALLAAGNAINLTYDDANDTLTVAVVDGNIDHDALTNFVANEHIDHSSVNVTAGAGLTGGGDITSTRTLNSHSVTTQSGNYTANKNDVVLADASGGAITVTLPSADSNIMVTVKKIDSSSNAVEIATPNSETIDGDTNRTITGQYISREITSDGTNYFII